MIPSDVGSERDHNRLVQKPQNLYLKADLQSHPQEMIMNFQEIVKL